MGSLSFGKDESGSPVTKALAGAAAVLITAAVTIGYFYVRSRNARPIAPKTQQQEKAPAQFEVVEDEAMLRGQQVLLAGTITNRGAAVSRLRVQLSLTRREGGDVESREVAAAPEAVSSGATTRYSLLASREFRSFRVSRIFDADRPDKELTFSSAQGRKRPAEPPPPTKIEVLKPRPKAGNDDFINTPDEPSRIP